MILKTTRQTKVASRALLSSLFLIVLLVLIASCKHEPRLPYVYEQNPKYSYMGVNFYEQYYDGIPNYVFSLYFYSELTEDNSDILIPGQYLYIEDLFVPKSRLDVLQGSLKDTVLTESMLFDMLKGEYKASGKVGSENFGDSLTFAPGEYFKVDSITYILGAHITYYEEDDYYSTRKLVTEGAFTIAESGIAFDFLTDDGLTLKGSYKTPQGNARKIRVKYSSERESERLK